MPTKEQDKLHTDSAEKPQRPLSGVIGDRILQALGRPVDLYRVDVRQLWEDHYRANVVVGADVVSSRIAQSYFLVTDAGGNILTSTPSITRQY